MITAAQTADVPDAERIATSQNTARDGSLRGCNVHAAAKLPVFDGRSAARGLSWDHPTHDKPACLVHGRDSAARSRQMGHACGRAGTKKWRGELTVEDDDVARVGVDLLGLEDLARVRGRVGADEHLDARSVCGGGRELDSVKNA